MYAITITERERMGPPQRNKRVYGEHPGTSTHPDGKSGLNSVSYMAGFILPLLHMRFYDNFQTVFAFPGNLKSFCNLFQTKAMRNQILYIDISCPD
jgi:hypothetical protein